MGRALSRPDPEVVPVPLCRPESEIDVHHPAGGHHGAEFDDWRWERFENLPDVVVPFKRPVYEAVAAAFAPLATPRLRREA